jgi:hypothetical protein
MVSKYKTGWTERPIIAKSNCVMLQMEASSMEDGNYVL